MPIFSKVLGGIDENDPKSLKQIANHIRVMQEELEYRLSVLDSSNITEIDTTKTKIITPQGDLYHLIGELGGDYSEFVLTLEEFKVTVQDYEETVDGYTKKVSQFEQTVDGFEMTVKSYEESVDGYTEQVSSFEQTVEGFELSVKNLTEEVGHSLRLDKDGVYITDAQGKTVTISGGQLDADSVTADSLHLSGDLTVYNGEDEEDIGGYMGYAASLQTGGSGMHMECGKGECAVTDSGARLMFHAELDEDGNGSPDHSMIAVYEGGAVISPKSKPYYFNTAAFYGEAEQDLGVAEHPWAQIYTAAAAATTSDLKAKHSIAYDIDPRYDLVWEALRPCTGKYVNGRSDRTHMFLIAQDVEQAIEQAGLTSKDFGAFVRNGELCSLRYEEFIPMIIRRVQRLEGILEGGGS